MSAKTLNHDEITRYNRIADAVARRTRTRLEFLRMRSKELCGLTADPNRLHGMGNLLESALADPNSERDADKRVALEQRRAVAVRELCALVDRARSGVPEAIQELAELRRETIDLYIRAKGNWLMFFREVNLQPNEQAVYVHSFRSEVDVKYIGQGGSPRTYKAVRAQKQTFIDLRELWSDEVSYPIRDVNLGPDIAAMAAATVDIAWDLDAKVNALAKALFDTLIGSFTTTGAKINRTYIPNAHINTSNLPTTNSIVLSGNTSTSKFRLDAIRQTLRYCESWSDVWGEPLRPTGVILIPSSDAADLSEEFSPTGQAFNATADGIVSNYSSFEWMSVRWTLVPDVTLPPGVAYPVLNRPVGDVFLKPSMDEEFVETNRKKNLETRAAMKVINFASPQPMRVNALSVRYRT